MPGKPADRSIDFNKDVSDLEPSIRRDPAGRETEGCGVVPQDAYQYSGLSPAGFFFCRSANAAARACGSNASPDVEGMTGSQALTLLQGLSLPVHRNGSSGSGKRTLPKK